MCFQKNAVYKIRNMLPFSKAAGAYSIALTKEKLKLDNSNDILIIW